MLDCPACGAANPERYQRCGQCGTPLHADRTAQEIRRFATVVNSDLKGSTALGEKLDPESLREVLGRYFDEMRLVFESHGGTIEKIIGDAIVAVFGLPNRRDDDAIRAVRAAGESMHVLAALNDQLERQWGVRLVVRTGISSGDVTVGEAAAGQHVLTGDTMRISSAMEQNAPPLEVLIAQPTIDLVRDLVEVEPMGPITPRGSAIPVETYRLIGQNPEGERVASTALAAGVEGEPGRSSDGVTCPTCGFENDAETRLCGMCGSTIAVRGAARESRKTVTLVFADPKPTSLTGEPLSAEALRDVMTRYFEAMRHALSRHGGTVEKFIGDAVMAVYGLPVRHEDDAIRAIRAAAEMQAALPALNEAFRAEWGVEIRNHIGVNTGEVIAGDASTGQRLVTGDAVNTAARLEQAAGPGEVILGDLTWQLARDRVEVEGIPPLTLKGKAEPVPAWRLLSVRERPAPPTEEATAFVGREAELGRLATALADAIADGRPRLLTVVGDPGVGKTRLIKEYASRVARSATVVSGRCLPYGDGITFWPLAEIVRAAAGIRSDDLPDVAVERIEGLLNGPRTPAADRKPVADRVAAAMGLVQAQYPVAELFWGARKLLESLAQDRPLVAIVDDLHSAEATFLDLLDHVVDAAEGAPIVLLCTARHVLVDRHPAWAESHADRSILLAPLSDGDTGRMIEELLGNAGLEASIVERVVTAAEGNPLFVEQMISLLVDSGALRRDGDRWVATGSAAEIRVPPTIHALLAARLDDLSDEERSVVEPASIVGLLFARAAIEYLVRHFVEGGLPTIPEQLGSLARKQFVRPDTLDNEPAFRFGHQLIRDTAYGSLLKRERVMLHERFVEWADEINRQRGRETEFEEILGYHLEQAFRYRRELGPLDAAGIETGVRASRRLASAGRRATTRGDFPAAASLLDRAAALLPEDHPDRPALLVAAGEALLEIGEFARSERALVDAARTAGELEQPATRITAELVRLQLHLRSEASTSIDDVRAAAMAAIAELERLGDPRALARAWRVLVLVYGISGQYGKASEANLTAIGYAREAGDRVLEARLLGSSAQGAMLGPMPAPAAIAVCEDLVASAADDRRSQATTLAALARLRAMCGDFDGARRDYRRGRAILEELGLRFDAATFSLDSGPTELLAGDPAAAEAELRRDFETLDAMGERNYISTTAGLLAEALYRQGRFDEAGHFAEFCRDVAAPSDFYSQYLWRGVRGKLLARDGAGDEGVELAKSALTATKASDDIESQANALIFIAEAHLAAAGQGSAGRGSAESSPLTTLDVESVPGAPAPGPEHLAAAAAAAEAARELFEAKGDIVSAARAVQLASLAVPDARVAT
jgi:class 3 adenylate cyclase/tetratricopeptide (TPR) repeat protein